ncbi:MAG: dynamin family protein [Coleofasciculus chthonoplastes F3-SA18-01]|uniref:dynamin family protein n=1 Tax=Coleofasciculus chthonoplastes TaxID=64178 RepID=UPI003301EE82
MSSEQFQATYESIHSTGTRLLQYLREIEEGRRSEGNNSEGLHSIEDELNKALEALQAQKYQVAVIAAMKAGKSTFLNAMIGADILASESEACTVCRTDVRLLEAGQVPNLLEYRQGQRKPIPISEGDSGKIRQDFLDRTREIRENNNSDNTTRFELWHPIEAISKYSSLAGFTLVDTPKPNEWQSTGFNTVALKQTALEALRTCNAILFVLDYSSFKDNTNSELLQDLIEQRGEFLAENTGKIYFILNKVDRKSERDREIADVIEDLKKTLISFGIPEPNVYPVSAWQGLLAKLIQQSTAAESQLKDFKRFFSAKYATENEEGDLVTPAPRKIAPQALKDSGIPTVEDTVIQTIIRNSGWNLLNDVLASIDKAAKATEDSLKLQIKGWELEINSLKIKIEKYRIRAEYAKKKVQSVRKSVKEQEQRLTNRFSQGINLFAEGAKKQIQDEIDRIAKPRTDESAKANIEERAEPFPKVDIPSNDVSVGLTVPKAIPILGGSSFFFRVQHPLVEALKKFSFSQAKSDGSHKIKVTTEAEAKQIGRTINEFCAPHIQNWWIDTQDQLIREGGQIREELVQKIQEDVQQISNELSDYLGEALQVELNINPIQFPGFEFKGIDAIIQDQQEVYRRKETKTKCCSKETYDVEAKVDSHRSFYEVDLGETARLIKSKIDEQVKRNLALLERVIEKQVSADFRSAEQQINEYIQRFQDELDSLLRDWETKEAEAEQIRAKLEDQKTALNEYLSELTSIRESLNTWKPM